MRNSSETMTKMMSKYILGLNSEVLKFTGRSMILKGSLGVKPVTCPGQPPAQHSFSGHGTT
jgi:hypothetical protein